MRPRTSNQGFTLSKARPKSFDQTFSKFVGAAANGGRPSQRAKLPYRSKAPRGVNLQSGALRAKLCKEGNTQVGVPLCNALTNFINSFSPSSQRKIRPCRARREEVLSFPRDSEARLPQIRKARTPCAKREISRYSFRFLRAGPCR